MHYLVKCLFCCLSNSICLPPCNLSYILFHSISPIQELSLTVGLKHIWLWPLQQCHANIRGHLCHQQKIDLCRCWNGFVSFFHLILLMSHYVCPPCLLQLVWSLHAIPVMTMSSFGSFSTCVRNISSLKSPIHITWFQTFVCAFIFLAS